MFLVKNLPYKPRTLKIASGDSPQISAMIRCLKRRLLNGVNQNSKLKRIELPSWINLVYDSVTNCRLFVDERKAHACR